MFRIAGIAFHLYGLLIGLGMWAALEVAIRAAKRVGLKQGVVEEAWWWAIIAGVIGARIYHVIDYFEFYSQNPLKIFYLWEGGLGIFGGLIGGILGLWLFTKLKKGVSFLTLLDVSVVGVPLAQAIGRWGNYFNQEIYGGVTKLPWGIKVNEFEDRVHPLFLYESLLDFCLFVFLWLAMKREWKAKKQQERGRLTGLYLFGYGLIRFLLEPLRGIEIWKIEGVAVAQIFALMAMLSGWWLYKRSPRSGGD